MSHLYSYRRRALALLFACLLMTVASADEGEALPVEATWLRFQPVTPLWVATRMARCWRFRIWVARTPQEFSRGLMFVQELDDDLGMLFAMQAEREISMWMRNTFIPLDILFADAQGTIVKIHENAIPHSLDYISSEQAVYAVLELPGGAASRRGIHAGDQIRHAHFGTAYCYDD